LVPFRLTDHVNRFFGAFGSAPCSFLCVVAGGGNDARDVRDGMDGALATRLAALA